MNKLDISLEKKSFFKLILGLGNKSLGDIKKIASIYAKAGVDMFDLTPDESVFDALYEGIKSQNLNIDDYFYCVSFAISDDKHGKKACISSKKCVKCLKCIKKCPYNAILFDRNVFVVEEKCIGCQRCRCSAITYKRNKIDIEEVLKSLQKYKIDCIELHISGSKTKDTVEEFKKIKLLYPQTPISVCISRENFSNIKMLKLLTKLVELSGNEKLIVQADGISMTGEIDDYASTLQAVATAQILKDLNVNILLSGGCNSKTLELAKMCNIDINGVAIGSYARLLIADEVNSQEFWYNEKVFESALEKAKNLVKTVKVESK